MLGDNQLISSQEVVLGGILGLFILFTRVIYLYGYYYGRETCSAEINLTFTEAQEELIKSLNSEIIWLRSRLGESKRLFKYEFMYVKDGITHRYKFESERNDLCDKVDLVAKELKIDMSGVTDFKIREL